ncbi:hypothetical protein M3936_22485 [Sutcliffiella horikoshii]|nr:hypothetical protein [Sutcliffiella horikoshii]MCM3620327.1 hypothetical protein [Sutcliffiella horikoshii]
MMGLLGFVTGFFVVMMGLRGDMKGFSSVVTGLSVRLSIAGAVSDEIGLL